MGLRDWKTGFRAPVPTTVSSPMVVRANDAGILYSSMEALEEHLRGTSLSTVKSGITVTAENALRLAAVYRCVTLISGAVGNMPLNIKRTLENGDREDAVNTEIWKLITRRPNGTQRPHAFRKTATAHVLLQGDFFALKVRGVNGHLLELLTLQPGTVTVKQRPDMTVEYIYHRPSDGKVMTLKQEDVFHLYSLTLNGVTGVTPIRYARETIGTAIAMEDHGAVVFKNGARVSGMFSTDKKLGKEGRQNIREGLNEYRQGAERDGAELILEEGMTYQRISMTLQDAQWIEARKLSAGDIYTMFGVPPHLASAVDKSGGSNWGTGLEEQARNFVNYTLEDYLTMWEDAVNFDLIPDGSDLLAVHDRQILIRGNLEARTKYYLTMLQYGVMSPNDVNKAEGRNSRDGGDIYYPPPNMTDNQNDTKDGDGNE